MNSGPTLSEASRGPDVRRLQVILVMVKLLDACTFGSKTQDAVKSFQQGNNLTADESRWTADRAALPAGTETPTLARGSNGAAVSALQKGLLAFGGANTATDPG